MKYPHVFSQSSSQTILAGLWAILSLLVFIPAYAGNGEEVFRQAAAYTVQIKTVTDIPFAGDSKSSSMGAGFVVDAKRGWVMTNAHVAARSPSQVRIKFRDGDYHEGKKLYVDPYLDLAILELNDDQTAQLTAASLDCTTLPAIGHPVGAFGHPWGLSYTGTRGIVSGVTSKVSGEMLQTDAPINGGNSGGPLVSLETGKIVGINTASMNRDDDQNTNFAVPMKYACRVLQLLQDGQDPSPPVLSTVFFKDLDDRGELTVAETYLDEDTIALQPGDIINSVVGVSGEIENEGQLVHALRGRLDPIGLKITRDGNAITVSGRLRPVGRITERKGVYLSGLLFGPAGFRDSRELNVQQPLMVHWVNWGSLGESLEVEKWDVLVKLDGQPVRGLDDLYRRLEAAREQDEPCVFVLRRWSGKKDHVYDYIERTVAIEALEFIGTEADARLARK